MAGFLRRYTNLMSVTDMLLRKQLTLLPTATWQDANDRRSIELFKDKTGYASVVAMCLTEASETFHHWQIFAGGDSGVCVEFDKDALLNLFSDESKFMVGPMDYMTLERLKERTSGGTGSMPFFKRWGYKAEQEYRVIGFSNVPQKTISVPFNPSIIRRITFSPFTNETLAHSTRQALAKIDDCASIKWARSTLIENGTWLHTLESFARWEQMAAGVGKLTEALEGNLAAYAGLSDLATPPKK